MLAIVFAFVLDLIFGDPRFAWHPVRLIGRLISRMERWLNTDAMNKRFSGIFLVIFVVSMTMFCVAAILKIAAQIHPVIYFIFYSASIYFAISIKDLRVEANKVKLALLNNDIKSARHNLSMIAGRDTMDLAKPEVIRGTVETVAESTMDGIIAPLFYAFVGGPVFVWMYKAVNTLDSMVGYKNKRFIDFGMASAKIDSFLNLIPAKITSICIFISSCPGRRDWARSGSWVARYLLKGPRYNSESTEAAMAGVLGVQLGGINFYDSVPARKAIIGDHLNDLEIEHITKSVRIMCAASALCVGIGVSLIWIIG